MKKTRTLRGILNDNETRRLIVDDGRATNGYKVTSFMVFGNDMSSGAADCTGTLAINFKGAVEDWDASDNRQIGWAGYTQSTSYAPLFQKGTLDPDHIVITDLYVHARSNATKINYLITLEKVTISEDESILQLIKERAQDDLN